MSSDRKILRATRIRQKDYINSLPEEVLCIIFDKLSGPCVKSASLVCQRWAGIIFMTPYIRRFRLVISFDSYCYSDWNSPTYEMIKWEKLKELQRIAPKSQRCYRHLTCCVHYWKEYEFTALREVFLPKLASHLQTICFLGEVTSKDFSLIAEVIPTISGLQELVLKDLEYFLIDSDSITTLRNSSIKHLFIETGPVCRLDMPQLESFTGALSIFYPPDDSPEPLPLPNLKHVNATSGLVPIRMTTDDPSIFRRFTHIEKFTLKNGIVTSAFLLELCESCSTLRELRFEGGMELSHPSDAKHLSKLIHLRILVIKSYNLLSAIDLSQLFQLEELELDVHDIVRLPITISKLKMRFHAHEQLISIKNFLTSSTQLTVLEIDARSSFGDLRNFEYHVPREVLKALPLLKHLEVLMFKGGCFLKPFFQGIDAASLKQLRKLQFLDSRIFMPIAFIEEKFPNGLISQW